MKKALKWLFIVVVTISIISGLVIYFIKESNYFKTEYLDRKFVYILDTLSNQKSKPIMVSTNIEKAREVVSFYKGTQRTIQGGKDMFYMVGFIEVLVLEYLEADSSIVRIYTKYKYDVAPRTTTVEGLIPRFVLHDTLPDGVEDTLSLVD